MSIHACMHIYILYIYIYIYIHFYLLAVVCSCGGCVFQQKGNGRESKESNLPLKVFFIQGVDSSSTGCIPDPFDMISST